MKKYLPSSPPPSHHTQPPGSPSTPSSSTSASLSREIRGYIKGVSCPLVLSGEWRAQVAPMGKIGAAAFYELERGAGSHREEGLLGRAPLLFGIGQDESAPTAWETSNVVVRFILEEGKSVVLVRAMQQLKAWQRAQGGAQRYRGVSDEDARLVLSYEQALGVVLALMFEAVEVASVVDLPLLFSHCAEVLDYSAPEAELPGDRIGFEWMQESMVFRYMAGVSRHLDRIDQARAVAFAEPFMRSAVRFLARHAGALEPPAARAAAYALAGFLATEEGRNARDRIYASQADKRALVAVHEALWKPLCTDSLAVRKDLQSLIEAYRDFQDELED
jgi:hypothetical protein